MKRRTTKEFIEDSKKIHGDEYDYSKCVFKNVDTKVTIICKIHGEFYQRADHHLRGHKCKKCSSKFDCNELETTKNNFISHCKIKHNNYYNYEKVIYKNAKTDVIVICPEHGDFLITPDSHRSGSGCYHCGIKKIIRFFTKPSIPKSVLIEKAKELQIDEYDYSLVQDNIKNNKTKIQIICKKHGIFLQSLENHIGRRQGCPLCKNRSKSEQYISKILTKNKVAFTYQKTFDDFRNEITNYPLRFDFFLDDSNTVIEFDGKHHFEEIEKWGGEKYLLETQKRDIFKDLYCRKNGIKIIRIPYYENIKERLLKENIIKII